MVGLWTAGIEPALRKVPALSHARRSAGTYVGAHLSLVRLVGAILAENEGHLFCIQQPIRVLHGCHIFLEFLHGFIDVTLGKVILYGSHHIGQTIELEDGLIKLLFKLANYKLYGAIFIFVALSGRSGGLLEDIPLLKDAVCYTHGLFVSSEPFLLQVFTQFIPLACLTFLKAASADGHLRVKLDIMLGKHTVTAIHHAA